MTESERYAWLSLLAWIGIMLFLMTRFTTGYEIMGNSIGFTIVEQSAGRLLGIYLGVMIFAIIAEGIIAGATAARGAGKAVGKDERDLMISRRASLASYGFMALALNLIVLHVLASATYGQPVIAGLDFTSSTGIAFAILFVLVSAEVVNRATLVWNYRRT
jgi:hypothetical protein